MCRNSIMDLVALEQLINRHKDEFDEYLKNAKRGNAYCEAKEKCCVPKSATLCQTLTNAKPQSEIPLNPEESWRRECLAYSFQWYSPLFMNTPLSCASITKLGGIIHCGQEAKFDMICHHLSKLQQTMMILTYIKNADYETIEKCLHIMKQENLFAIQQIWKLFEQYQEIGIDSLQCGYCKIRYWINATQFSVYLWRHGVISDKLFQTIIASCSEDDSQGLLWETLETELAYYEPKKDIILALSEALENCVEMKNHIKDEIKSWMKDPSVKFSCVCKKLYFDVPRHNELDSGKAQERNAGELECKGKNRLTNVDKNKRRTKSRSTSGTRRSLSCQDTVAQELKCKFPTRDQDKESEIQALDNGKSITVDRKKSTRVININHSGHGSVNVDNSFVRLGKQELSDTSVDTESCKSTFEDSGSDTGKLFTSIVNKEIRDRINVSRSSSQYCKYPTDYKPEFEVKTSRRRRTVSESAISSYKDHLIQKLIPSFSIKESFRMKDVSEFESTGEKK